MTGEQFELLRKAAVGETQTPPVALIVDSPWMPGFLGIDTMAYFTQPDVWLRANIDVIERFPGVIFLPGFWVEYGMAIEPSAFGCKISWWSNQPPSMEPVLTDISRASKLSVPSPKTDGLMPFALHLQKWAQKEMAPMGYSIKMVAARGPLALAAHLRGIIGFLTDIKIDPENSHKLLYICTKTVIKWLQAQVENLPDVEGILVLDDIPGLLSPADYDTFAHQYLSEVFNAFPGMLKTYHNDANIDPFAERLANTGFDILNFSHEIDIADLRRRIGDKITLMGNVPPLSVLARGKPEDVESSARYCLNSAKNRLLLSAGGGTSPGTPAANIDALVSAVRTLR